MTSARAYRAARPSADALPGVTSETGHPVLEHV